jgi:transposase-like protein
MDINRCPKCKTGMVYLESATACGEPTYLCRSCGIYWQKIGPSPADATSRLPTYYMKGVNYERHQP